MRAAWGLERLKSRKKKPSQMKRHPKKDRLQGRHGGAWKSPKKVKEGPFTNFS